ncbi:hypothetical protein [Saccharolobus islandicus]|uniref:hypothetical protein n=1 Tax=Saccharolobus islandicus TaxID=43080 RepID=UPI00064E38EC|nr:hypothetical protein [Sulfolobus islandicus]
MLRILKKLVGIWEPKEGVIYRQKFIGQNTAHIIPGEEYVSIYVEYSLNGVNWQPCTFSLKKGVYEIHAKDKYNRTTEILLVEKKFVKAKKIKKKYIGSESFDWTATFIDIYYRLLIKDPSKIRYLKRN